MVAKVAEVMVVVSPVGMNADVLAHGEIGYAARGRDEWVDSLSALLVDSSRAAAMGAQGRAVAEAHYSLNALAPKLAALLRGVA